MSDEKQAPVVRVRNRGQITRTLARYADAYRAAFPEMACRYVYDPENKPELSKVTSREADGYRLIRWKDLGIPLEGIDVEKVVRVADLVLMAVDKVTAKQLVTESNELAARQMKSVQRKYYDEQEQAAEANKSEHHTRPGMAPIGSAVIATKDFAYDVEQRSGAGET